MNESTKAILSTLAVGLAVAVATWITSLFVKFNHPQRLFLVAVPITVYGLWSAYQAWRAHALDTMGNSDMLHSLSSHTRPFMRWVRPTLLVGSAMLSTMAWATPQWGEETRKVEQQGIDVVLAVDISRSMLAEDIPPNRLQAALSELRTLLQNLQGDRVGLVVYAGVAFTQSPLTSDYGAIQLYLDRLSPKDLPAQGTAIGRAIEEGRRLLTGDGSESFKRAQHQLMVVVSDGEDHHTAPVKAAEKAASQGIRVFTVGVGSKQGARIPLRDESGSLREYLTDRQGNVVTSTLKDQQLREIASAGGGSYIRYEGPGSVVKKLRRTIESFDEDALSSTLRAEYVDRPLFFLIPAALLLLLFIASGGKGKQGKGKQGKSLLTAISIVLLTTAGCNGIEQDNPAVQKAIEASKEGTHDEAVSYIEQANEEARQQAEYWFDRGLVHERAQNYEDSQKAYLHALGMANAQLRDDSLVGLGNALFHQEQYREARTRYERALQLNHKNQAARRNLEIALRHEFPPCRELDDDHEDNDDIKTAVQVPQTSLSGRFSPKGMQRPQATNGSNSQASEEQQLVVCGGDDDYYKIPVHGGDTLSITAIFDRLRDDTGGPPPPEKIPRTDVRLTLRDSSGKTIIAVDQGMADVSKTIDAEHVEREIDDVHIPRSRGTDGYVILQIEAEKPLEFNYTLKVAAVPPCRALEDDFEPNDERLGATSVTPGGNQAVTCKNDSDWYSVHVDQGDDIFVDIPPGQTLAEKPLNLHAGLYDVYGNQTSSGTTSDKHLATVTSTNAPKAGEVTFNIEGVNDEGGYKFELFHYPPCPAGGDRFEPNNTRSAAANIKAAQAPFRHLRLCDGDADWYRVTIPPKPPESSSAPQKHPPTAQAPGKGNSDNDSKPRPFSAQASYKDDARTVDVALFDAKTFKTLGRSSVQKTKQQPGQTRQKNGEKSSKDNTAHLATSTAATILPEGTNEIVVRVSGDAGYYHLSFPETKAEQQRKQQQQQNKNQQQKDENQSSNKSKGSEDKQDKKGEKSKEQKNKQQQQDAQKKNTQQAKQRTEKEQKEKALKQMLNSLEDKDVNLQLQQALDDIPPTQMRNEW